MRISNEALLMQFRNLTDILNEIQTATCTLSSSTRYSSQDGNQDASQTAEINRLKFALTAVQELVKRAKNEVKSD